ncbi:hypothetical protein LEP1GSC116_2023 [Leptospira interrogans serovar Icterohaemorrhagiae str. Verdun HP]|uniref:Uncharacterized protein n=3 Tax=Leptospira interrogans TaxID=173 RepID=M6REI0_LEPIR|nr:hypothetical protein LEP1GSC150_1175 [Leptospira interrogans serovar Copenhageni str. LT2050]EMN30161.1 hypothetical protein LEP1GSC083_2998 [Leptospira interrogans serovar Pyrogenes str. L0374]EMO04141.1 hypothetical protein LEP1GSC116_2023 [Leptospira interrogans serovar Icterohaemorrhagiae str. Verdun HP]
MKIIGVINIQSSLFISSLSAVGLGVLLSITQVKTPENFQEMEFSPLKEKTNSVLPSKKKENQRKLRRFKF